MNICVLSCCYEKPELATLLRESCEEYGYDLMMCEAAELNHKWPESGDMITGKMVAALEGLKLIRQTESYSHILWADGFDTFMQHGSTHVLKGLNYYGSPPLIFSAEKNCWPDQDSAGLYPPSGSAYRFINAGTWLAQVGYMIDALEVLIPLSKCRQEVNDQRIYTRAFLEKQLPGAVIDTERVIFQTMWGTELREVKQGASVIHYNGGVWRDPSDTRMRDHWLAVRAL